MKNNKHSLCGGIMFKEGDKLLHISSLFHILLGEIPFDNFILYDVYLGFLRNNCDFRGT